MGNQRWGSHWKPAKDRQDREFSNVFLQSNCTVARTSHTESSSFQCSLSPWHTVCFICHTFRARTGGQLLKGDLQTKHFLSCLCHGCHLVPGTPTGSSYSAERRGGRQGLERPIGGAGCGFAGEDRHIWGDEGLLVCDFPLNRKRWFTFSIYISQWMYCITVLKIWWNNNGLVSFCYLVLV